jgi:diketogulonate reductase-like aldo/keto reductase
MNAIQNQFTQQMRDRLQTNVIGLGLVRLLQDARLFMEARAILHSLECGVQIIEAAKSIQKPCKANRLNGVPISF